MTAGALQFAAFLSYSRQDKRLALWLVGALEGFAPPRKTVSDLAAGRSPFTAPRPIFRDEHDMPVGGAVPERLAEVLEASASMIVLCSPASARSDWVNKEIRLFAERHPERRIIAAVAQGDPDSDECYPSALRALGKPLAADLRAPRDRRQAVVKIAAAVLGVEVDQLVERVKKRSAERKRWIAGFASVALGLFIGLSATAVAVSMRASDSDARARATVKELLTKTRAQVDNLQARAAVHKAAEEYFEGRSTPSLTDDDLLLKAEWLRQEGNDAGQRNEAGPELVALSESYEATEELLKRDPRNPEYLFPHSQTAYWISDHYRREGNIPQALRYTETYRDVSERLLAVSSNRQAAAFEVFSANFNIGVLKLDEQRDPRAAVTAFSNSFGSLDSFADDAVTKLYLSRAHQQYVEALAQFAPASIVLEAVQDWEPLLHELEARSETGPEFKRHIANAWNLVVAVERRTSVKPGPEIRLRAKRGPEDDPDDVVSLRISAELRLAAGDTPECGAAPAWWWIDPQDRTQVRLIQKCLSSMTLWRQKAYCVGFSVALDPRTSRIDKEEVWALLLAACSRSAVSSGDERLAAELEDIATKRFFKRKPEELRLWTQLALADFQTIARNAWIAELNASLDNRGWT